MTASQDESNKYEYNIVSVVLFTEVLKLIISAGLYCKGYGLFTCRTCVNGYRACVGGCGIFFCRPHIGDLELISLFFAISFIRRNRFVSLFKEVIKGKDILLLYFVPAFLYCIYNNLAFVNLSTFDPTTYYLLLQFRVVVTGILFQVIWPHDLCVIDLNYHTANLSTLSPALSTDRLQQSAKSRAMVLSNSTDSWMYVEADKFR